MIKGLIIKDPWISMILHGVKTWEMRSRNTKIRGRILLIKSGSGKVYGEADLVDVINFKDENLKNLMSKIGNHCVDYSEKPEFNKYRYAWVLENVFEYEEPIPYIHPQGAVIWVKF